MSLVPLCDMCEAGKFAVSTGTVACTSCPPGKTGVPGSVSEKDCNVNAVTNSPFVVTMTASLPMMISEFDDGTRTAFKKAIAKAASVSSSDVTIDNVKSISTARRGVNVSDVGRRLLAAGIRIDMSVKAADTNAADAIVAKLTVTGINAKLREAGLPAATILEAPQTVASGDGPTDVKENSGELLLIVVGGAVGGCVLWQCVFGADADTKVKVVLSKKCYQQLCWTPTFFLLVLIIQAT